MIIDGRALASQLNLQIKSRVDKLSFRPLLIDVLIGNDPASESYVKIKQRTAQNAGLDFELVQLSSDSTTDEVQLEIKKILLKPNLCGLLVQLPLPDKFNEQEILASIPKELDVDVLSQQSRNDFYSGDSEIVPPTAGAILHILDSLNEPCKDLQFLVLGQGELVGKPITFLLQKRGLKVVTADNSTENISELIAKADCIISGVGKANLISQQELKSDCIIIDAGTSEANGSIAGDVDFAAVNPKVKYITPVPGGVGPVTVAKLLENVLSVAVGKN